MIVNGRIAMKKGIRIDQKTKSDLYDKFSSYALDLSKLVLKHNIRR